MCVEAVSVRYGQGRGGGGGEGEEEETLHVSKEATHMSRSVLVMIFVISHSYD
jgi:hypothetical protein